MVSMKDKVWYDIFNLMRGLNYKFIAIVAALFLFPFMALSIHFFSVNRDLLKKDTLNYLESRSKITASIIGEILDYSYAIPDILREESFVKGGLEKRKEILGKLSASLPGVYYQISLVNRAGKEIARVGGNKKVPFADFSKDEVFINAVKGGDSVGRVEHLPDYPPILILAEAIPSPDQGQKDGIAVTFMSLARVAELIKQGRRTSEEEDGGLIDSGGMLIADSEGTYLAKPGMLAGEEILRLARDLSEQGAHSGAREAPLGKKDVWLVSAAEVEGTQWWAYEKEPASVIKTYKSVSWAKRIIAGGILLILVFSLLTERLAFFYFFKKQS